MCRLSAASIKTRTHVSCALKAGLHVHYFIFSLKKLYCKTHVITVSELQHNNVLTLLSLDL